jgi:hypothetical protein
MLDRREGDVNERDEVSFALKALTPHFPSPTCSEYGFDAMQFCVCRPPLSRRQRVIHHSIQS